MTRIDGVWSEIGPWIHESEAAPVLVANSAPGLAIFIDGAKVRTLDHLFDVFFDAFQFPSYFGRNWPAFVELLRDLSWMSQPAYLVVVANAGELLADEPAEMPTFLRLFGEVARYWSDAPGRGRIPFNLLLVAS